MNDVCFVGAIVHARIKHFDSTRNNSFRNSSTKRCLSARCKAIFDQRQAQHAPRASCRECEDSRTGYARRCRQFSSSGAKAHSNAQHTL